MNHVYKIKFFNLFLLFVLLCVSLLLVGCSQQPDDEGTNQPDDEGTNQPDYVGTYLSTFIDSQNDDDNISFTLVINEDKTFVLTGHNHKEMEEFSGYYKLYTVDGQEQFLFIVEKGFEWNPVYPNAWNPYFSICRLDDGTLMATAGTTFSSNGKFVSVFGSGSVSIITLILFTKQ